MPDSDHEQRWPWFAVQVRIRTEKIADKVLRYQGYECFLPLQKVHSRWSDRIKKLDVPLFPGYLFCRFDVNNRLPVLKTPGVLQIVGIGKVPVPVDEAEIQAIQHVTTSGLPAKSWPYLQVGHVAKVEDGPLRGLTGIVTDIKSEVQLVLSVTLLQRSVAVKVQREWLAEPHAFRPAPSAVVLDISAPRQTELATPAKSPVPPADAAVAD